MAFEWPVEGMLPISRLSRFGPEAGGGFSNGEPVQPRSETIVDAIQAATDAQNRGEIIDPIEVESPKRRGAYLHRHFRHFAGRYPGT